MSAPEPVRTITAVAFDLGNVLVGVDQSGFCRRLAAYTQASPEEISALVFNGPLKFRYDSGLLTTPEFYQQITDHLQSTLSYDQFCALWTGFLTPWEHMTEVVARLQPRYPLVLVSNTDPLHFEYVKAHFPVMRHFCRYILSYELGCQKPDPRIYQTLLAALDCPPEQCLFIDDLLINVEAARRHGLQAWQFLSCAGLKQRLARQGLW